MTDDYEVEPSFKSEEEAHDAASIGGTKVEGSWACPECGGGFVEDPHRFLDHLKKDHDYSSSEAFDILNG